MPVAAPTTATATVTATTTATHIHTHNRVWDASLSRGGDRGDESSFLCVGVGPSVFFYLICLVFLLSSGFLFSYLFPSSIFAFIRVFVFCLCFNRSRCPGRLPGPSWRRPRSRSTHLTATSPREETRRMPTSPSRWGSCGARVAASPLAEES